MPVASFKQFVTLREAINPEYVDSLVGAYDEGPDVKVGRGWDPVAGAEALEILGIKRQNVHPILRMLKNSVMKYTNGENEPIPHGELSHRIARNILPVVLAFTSKYGRMNQGIMDAIVSHNL